MEQSIKSVLVKQTLTQQQQFASLQVRRTRTCALRCARPGWLTVCRSDPADGVSDHGLRRRALPSAVGA